MAGEAGWEPGTGPARPAEPPVPGPPPPPGTWPRA